MNSKAAKVVFGVGTVLVFALISEPLWGQDAPATLSGAVTDSSGKALPSAKISVKNVATGQSIDTQTDASGVYAVPNLTAGDYAVSVSAEGFGAKAIKITLAARTPQTVDFALTPAQRPFQQSDRPIARGSRLPLRRIPGKRQAAGAAG